MTYEPLEYAKPVMAVTMADDRRGWLIGAGVVSILLGCLAACGVFGMVMAVIMFTRLAGAMGGAPPSQGADPYVIFGVFIAAYLAAAVLFVWVGVDSIRCKRWVRPVIIAVAWMAMVGTAFVLAAMVIGMAGTTRTTVVTSGGQAGVATQTTVSTDGVVTTTTVTPAAAGNSSAVPATAGGGTGMSYEEQMVLLVYGGVMFLLGIVLPALYVWLFSTAAVRRTLEAYDPTASWTERAPLPVFVACAWLLVGGLLTVPMAFVQATPLFTTYLTGAPAVALTLLAAIVMILAAVMMFRGRRAGWWWAVAVVTLGYASMITALAYLGPVEMYRQSGMKEHEVEEAMRSPAMGGVAPLVFTMVAGALSVVFLIWVGKFFRGATWEAWRRGGGAGAPGVYEARAM